MKVEQTNHQIPKSADIDEKQTESLTMHARKEDAKKSPALKPVAGCTVDFSEVTEILIPSANKNN